MKSFKYYIQEARRNPDLNPKVPVNKRIKDHLDGAEDIWDTNIPNSFTSFTQIEKLGINPNSRYDTPIGIYSYPSFYVYDLIGDSQPTKKLPFAGDQPYVNLFSVQGSILDVSDMDSRDLSYYYQLISKMYIRAQGIREKTPEWKEAVDYLEMDVFDAASTYAKFNSPGGEFWWVTREISKLLIEEKAPNWKARSEPVSWNRVFREIGIDGCIDSEGEGVIHTSEPVQAVFFTNRGFYDVEQHENKHNYTDLAVMTNQDRGKSIRKKKEYYNSLSTVRQRSVVRQDPRVFQYIKNPSEELQLAAIEMDPFAIEYIKNPTENAQLAAVQNEPATIGSIGYPTEKVQLAAVQADGSLIRYIENPSEEVRLAAIEKNPVSIMYMENPSEKVKQLADKLKAAKK